MSSEEPGESSASLAHSDTFSCWLQGESGGRRPEKEWGGGVRGRTECRRRGVVEVGVGVGDCWLGEGAFPLRNPHRDSQAEQEGKPASKPQHHCPFDGECTLFTRPPTPRIPFISSTRNGNELFNAVPTTCHCCRNTTWRHQDAFRAVGDTRECLSL